MTDSDGAYICPMHSTVRKDMPGRCPTCGMPLVPETARFRWFHHLLGGRKHLVVMGAVMLVLMAIAMMLMVKSSP